MDNVKRGLEWNEADRLAALDEYAILDTSREDEFDNLVRLTADLLEAPVAVVNLVARERQWFKAEIGLGVRELPLGNALGAKLLLQPDELVVPDLMEDPRFKGNPLVATGPGMRFYAAELLRSPEGLPLGTFCVLDSKPRPRGLTDRQNFMLRTLAQQAMGQLNLRRSLARKARLRVDQARSEAHRQQVLDSASDFAIISIDLCGQVIGWNAGAVNILGWTEAEMLGRPANLFFTPEDRISGVVEAEMDQAGRAGRAADERWHSRRDGSRFWASGEMMPLHDEAGVHIGYLKVLRDQTEQHLAGRALEVMNERLRLAQQATRDAIWDWSFKDNSVLWNEALQEAYGWPPDQVEPTGDWWIAQIHPEDRDRIHLNIHADIEGTRTDWSGEYRFRRADGTYAEVLDRGSIIRGVDGRAVRMIGAMLDISERKQAEAALARSHHEADRQRRLYEAILTNTPDLVYVWGLDHRFIYANKVLLQMWNRTWDEAVGRNCLELGYPDWHAAMHDREIEQVIATKQPVRGEVPFDGAFGLRIYEYILVPVIGEAGEVEAVAGTTRDVSEARETEAALKLHGERVQLALTAGAIIGTWLWDMPTDCFTVDEGFARTFGLDPALGRVGLSLEQVVATVHPDDKAGLAAAIKEVVARGGAYAHQYRVRRADGNYYWIEANGRVEHAPDGTPQSFPGVLIDVEERRAIEAERDRAILELRALTETLEQRVTERTAELMHAEEQLRQSQKMEAVGQLTGGIAHDFNNLLTGVTGNLELLGTRIAQGRLKELDRYIAAAQGAAGRASALTHRLLAFSRRQTLDPRPTDANRLIGGIEELIRRSMGPGISVEVVGAVGLWPTIVDPNQLENALLNLCINARDAMPDGGRLTIETANRWLDGRSGRLRDIPPGQYISLCVSDTGTGMTPEVIAKAFDPFFTTKPLGQGTGLGLSMIYGFTRQSGGQTRIYSEVGKGTMVCMYLPRHLGLAETPEAAPELTQAPRAEVGETVLVVDDEPTVRMLVTEVLEDLGYAALEASDGATGLKLLQSDARIDLLVSDVGLPGGMNGRQMADAARVVRPDLKVLFITGYAENAVVGDGHLAPGMHVLTKPFSLESLASRIRDLIAGA
ncbi:PAS domain S-box protein [Roseomonas sp. 18066]|uniref:PAS domain S-box protein n=1 Tax=Roseomonas sp. 18066 TaxID=2681412 RepID=UPI0013574B67|nr:PAS domain S-box protein [Roseomonas sp. 18066]